MPSDIQRQFQTVRGAPGNLATGGEVGNALQGLFEWRSRNGLEVRIAGPRVEFPDIFGVGCSKETIQAAREVIFQMYGGEFYLADSDNVETFYQFVLAWIMRQ